MLIKDTYNAIHVAKNADEKRKADDCDAVPNQHGMFYNLLCMTSKSI